MTQLGEGVVPIRATLDKLDRDLADAKGKIEGALSGVRATATKIGKAALVGITGGLLAIGGAAAIVGPKLVGMGADANETASLLENSLGETADDLNARLRQFADDANRSFYDLQQGSATFVAMTRSMGATQEQAADLSVGFTQMATDLGSFFNVSTENSLMDLQGALAGSSETLQKYGIDVRETTLKQMALDQGLIQSAKETLPRLVRAQLIQQAIMEQAADAMGDAERTSNSWQNTMRGLTGRIKDAATETGQKLIPALTPLLTLVGSLAEEWLPKLGDVLGNVVIPFIQTVAEAVASFAANLEEGMSPLDAFIEAIWDIAPQPVLDALVQLRDEIIPQLISWFEEVVQPILDVVASFVEWQDVAIAAAIAIGAIVIPVIWSIMAPILAVIAVGAALVAAVALVRTAWEENWGGIQEKTQAVVDFVSNLISQLKEWWAQNSDDIFAKANEIWERIRSVVQIAILAVQAIVTTVAEGIRQFWAEHGEAIMDTARQAWETITQAVDDAINLIKAYFAAFKSLFEGDWETFGENLYAIWKAAWELVTNFLSNIWDMVKPWLESLWTSITTWWDDIDWKSLGQGIIDGVVNGIRNAGSAVLETLGGIVNSAIEDIKARLGISSPSRVTARLIGAPMAEGVALGWQDALTQASFGQDLLRNVERLAAGMELGGGGRSTTYQISANYGYQDERRLRDDIRLLQMLNGV